MFNPEKLNSEPEAEITPNPEAEKLSEKLAEKTFGERFISEYQTRESKIRGTETERSGIFRFERGQIYKGYKILRKEIHEAEERGEDAVQKKDLLKKIREQAKILEKNLDEMALQYYENIRTVDVKTNFGEFSIPVVELDLRKKDNEEENDERTPYFFIPGMTSSSFHKSAATSMGVALQGHKVYVPLEIEQPAVKKPENFREMLRDGGDFKLHSEIFKQTIRSLGIKKVNILGHSLGATVALELATDTDFNEMEDLVAVEPLGIEDKGLIKLAKEFGLSQVLIRQLPYSETRIKGSNEGVGTKGNADLGLYYEDAKILSRKLYNPEKLSKINPKGRFQVWIGGDSPIINVGETEKVLKQTENIRRVQNPEGSQLELYEVRGGEHMWVVNNALGFARMITEKKPDEQITNVELSDLENSAMKRIIRGIK